MTYGISLQLIICFCLISIVMHVYALYCLKRISRKVSWWRNNAVKANSQLKNVNYKLNEIKKKSEMESTIIPSSN